MSTYRTIFLFAILLFVSHSYLFAEDKIKNEALREYVKQLGDSNYEVREKATRELIKISFKYAKFLSEELKNTDDLEIQERLKFILDQSDEKLNELFSEAIIKSQQLQGEKKYEEALKGVNEILEIKPDYERAINLKVNILEDKGDFKECILLLKKRFDVIQKDSNDYETIGFHISRLLINSGGYAEDVTHLETMLPNSRLPDAVLLQLRNAYELNNQFAKSEEIHLKEIAKNPKELFNTSNIAWFYIRAGKLEKAKTYLQVAGSISIDNDITDVLNNLFLQDYQKGADKIKIKTEPMLKELKGKTNLTVNDITPMDILFLCYQHYFEIAGKTKPSTDFKDLYNSFTEEDKKIWPVPLLGLYGGELTKEKMEAQLQSPNPWEMRMNKCEAWFYLGLLKVTENKNDEAKKYFQLSKDQKVFDYVETTASCFMLQIIK